MTPKRRKPVPPADAARALPLKRALDQSEQIKEKVQAAAQDLGEVNAALKTDVAAGVPLVQVQHALGRSEVVEGKVEEAAQELVAVNESLTEEIAERDALERRVALSNTKLVKSRAAERKARYDALHDAVTDLPNATLFFDRLEHAIEQAHRHEWRLAVMFIDLDGFKLINDTHGHHVGDRILQNVAQRLSSAVRAGDTVGRRGGDEFLFLMPEVRDDASALAFAAMLVDRVGQPADIDGVMITARPSVGVAFFPEDGPSADELLQCADRAMYDAKQGKLGVARFTGQSGKST